MIIKNGTVFTENFRFEQKELYIEDGRIVASEAEVSDKTAVDAAGAYVLPGLVDVHTHGAVGHDFSDADAEGLKKIARFEKQAGVTSFCPTSMTLPAETLKRVFQTAKEACLPDGARVVGINMEGPFIAAEKKGAQNGDYIAAPDYELFQECNEACGGLIRLVTLAPEVAGAEKFIKKAADEVHISIGHTTADYDTARRAFELGADHVTHLYNAMPPVNHREPGVAGAARDSVTCMAELISDGIHIHPSMIRATFALFGADRVVLISDSMMACGMPDGEYELGGQAVFMKGGEARLAGGALAGSTTNLFTCMQRAISFGVPAEEAIRAATFNPAKSIGLEHEIGSLAPGRFADVLLVSRAFELERVL